MTAVVTDNCEACRFTECVKVCPVSCFHGDETMLFIDGDVCIDCCACIPACPVQAIYMDYDLPSEKSEWLAANRTRAAELPLVARPAEPLATAQEKRASLGF